MNDNSPKKTISVKSASEMLGIQDGVMRYLCNKGYFKTIRIEQMVRIDAESFEDWYDRQWHYHKVDGTLPGSKNTDYITKSEIVKFLGAGETYANHIIYQRAKLKTYRINGNRCYLRSDFEAWYNGLSLYRKRQMEKLKIEWKKKCRAKAKADRERERLKMQKKRQEQKLLNKLQKGNTEQNVDPETVLKIFDLLKKIPE